ncbi:MAG: Rieske 2Fe-2S domain-containing protein [Pirellulaceae bacterium]|nr:Rieske 2Fe-2S domain-containing protein [Pirellulaceae bacterium]
MSKSPNPPAAGPAPPSPEASDPPRRNLLAALAAIVIGGIVGLFPLGAGALVFLDPILRRKKKADTGEDSGRPFRRVAALDALPADGTPVQVPVLADLTDAWNREPNQPVGAVYLRKVGDQVECFNAICPHAGCFVAYSVDRKLFQCPCHTSSFQLDGTRILPSPSPRDMDDLKVDDSKLKEGEVWVQFVNYYPGHEEREAKP